MKRCISSYAVVVLGTLLLFVPAARAKDYKLEVEVTRPAAVRLEGVHKLGIATDYSSCNSELANKVSSVLFATGAFEMMERSQLDKLMKEHDLTLGGLTDPTKAPEMGKLLPIDAVVYASIDKCAVEDVNGVMKLKKKDQGGQCVQVDGPAIGRTGTLNVTFKVVKIETGAQVAVREFRRALQRSYVQDPYPNNADCYGFLEGNPKSANDAFMTPDQMKQALIDTAAIQFANYIAPHKEKMTLVWEDKVGSDLSKQVKTYLDAELFDDAVSALDKARATIDADTQMKPDDKRDTQIAAYYDTGLLAEMKGDFNAAKDWYKKAFELNITKPDKKVVESMKRTNAEIKEQAALQQQTAN